MGEGRGERDAWLALGTVVTLRGASRRVMVTGRLSVDPATGALKEYSACPWPEGVLDGRHFIMFDHADIASVDYPGPGDQDRQEHAWRTVLDRAQATNPTRPDTTTPPAGDPAANTHKT
ncbi:DUF4176 domain-containing protein [Bifidobacterium crudilactis]|jgi:hypothetical protein|uniref:DUF4176 domain-containing protein n=1 Tax=Bifidobacterium crudilactis TaxID=327277 RepID=UPI002F353382